MSIDYDKAARLNEYYQDKIEYALVSVQDGLDWCKPITSVQQQAFADEVVKFQRKMNMELIDGIMGPSTWEAFIDYVKSQCLDEQERKRQHIADPVVHQESGGDFSAMNRDGEYRGKFDDYWNEAYGHDHSASGEYHIGLSFGVFQFTQDSGSLGEMLQQAAKRNRDKFKTIFGDTWRQLLNRLNQDGPMSKESPPRGARVKPVLIDGREVDIWKQPWVDRFESFGQDPEFQQVQVEYAFREYLKPIQSFLKKKRLTTERMVSAAFSASIHRGAYGAKEFITSCLPDDIHDRKARKQTLQNMADKDQRYEMFIDHDELSNQSFDAWVES